MATIIPIEPRHLEGALRLSQAVGWPHRRTDWALLTDIGQGIAAVENGQVIGTALCVPFGDVAALNMIIVADTHQGRGLGRRLTQDVIALAGPRTQSLVATTAGLPLYRKLGFGPVVPIVQHQGLATEPPTPARDVRKGGPEDLARVAALDLAATGMDRRALLQRLLADGALYVGEGGFACRRDFGQGQVVGPIIASDAHEARELLHAVTADSAGRFLRVDSPEGAGLEPALTALGLARVGGGIEMHNPPAVAKARQPARFALYSQGLG